MADSTTEIDLDSVIDRLLEGMSVRSYPSSLYRHGQAVEVVGMRDGIWAVLLYGQHVALLALHLWWRLFWQANNAAY